MTQTLEHIDPRTLALGENVRLDAKIGAQFLASIRTRGVLQPVIAHRDPELGVVVDQGYRRTMAALKAGLPTIPVLVDDQPPRDGDRLVDQVIENEHRDPLTNSDRVHAVQQLALLGLQVDQIQKRAQIPFDDVLHATKIATSPMALEHADSMTLQEAALLAEFDGDEDATRRLLESIENGWGNPETVAQRIRDDRADQAAIAAFAAELAEQGVNMIDRPGYDDTKTLRLSALLTGGRKINTLKHSQNCPGHVVWVEHQKIYDTSSPLLAVPGCRDWKKHGHTSTAGYSSDGSKKPASEMDDDERAQARAERRHVIESNKDWKAATTVRRRWLAEFVQRKAAPSGAEAYIATTILAGETPHLGISGYLQDDNGGLFDILGVGQQKLRDELPTANPKRALQIVLAVLLAAREEGLPDDAWRSTYSHSPLVRTLTAISQWGHQLSDIEQRIVDGTADKPHPAEG